METSFKYEFNGIFVVTYNPHLSGLIHGQSSILKCVHAYVAAVIQFVGFFNTIYDICFVGTKVLDSFGMHPDPIPKYSYPIFLPLGEITWRIPTVGKSFAFPLKRMIYW